MEKEEFIRTDPSRSHKFIFLMALVWIVPLSVIVAGIVVSTQSFAAMMNYDAEIIGNPVFITKEGYRFYNPLVFLLSIFKYSFDNTYSYYFFKAIPATFIGLILAALIFCIATIFTSQQKNQGVYGRARFGNLKDLIKNGLLQKGGVVCGQVDTADVSFFIDEKKASMTLDMPKHFKLKLPAGKSWKFWEYSPVTAPLICHSGRTNTLLIAPTRSGKGVSSIITTLLRYGVPFYKWVKEKLKNGRTKKVKKVEGRGSIVCFDPKGENWAATAGFRSKFSTCIPFDPLNALGTGISWHYNPMAEIPDDPSGAYEWADMIANIFFSAEKGKGGGDDASSYFNNVARDIFRGVVMHVRFAMQYKEKERNLTTVLKMFSKQTEKAEGGNSEDGNDNTGAEMLAEMRNSIHIDDNGNKAETIHEMIVDMANRSESQVPKERASTYSTVISKIGLFQDPNIAQSTAYSDFGVDDFVNAETGISLYLIVPYNNIQRIAPVFRMLITFMIKKFSAGTTNANAVKLKVPCMFLLDEFPVLGYFPDIALNAGILAGYGVTFFIVCQSLNQLVDVYGENHPFLDHCKTIVLFAPGNIKDAKSFSETIGNRSVLFDNLSSSGSKWEAGFSNVSKSSQEVSTSLISPDELMKLDFSRALVFNQGMPPYRAKKVVYYKDPRFMKKAWLPEPDKEFLDKRKKYLPTQRHKKERKVSPEIEEEIKRMEAINALEVIPDDYLFPEK